MSTLSLFCENCRKLVVASPLPDESGDGALGLCPVCGSRLFPNRKIEPGTEINGFRIDREIGRGGMGVVYLARQLNLDRDVAFKILSDEMASDTAFVEAFFHEARAAAALNHPNIVQAFDAGVGPDNVYYFVMELIEGQNLEVYTAEHGALDFDLAFKCATSIADALTYAWNYKKLAHRDIKPENIILKNTDEFKLADLGLAKDYHEGAAADTNTDTMATPAYASPEVIRCETGVDGFKSDMYSFGATLYQLFTGRPPFVAEDPNEVCEMQLNCQPKPLIGINSEIPSRLSMLVDKLMEKAPEKRPPSWSIVLEELNQIADLWFHRQIQHDTEIFSGEEEDADRRRRYLAISAALLLTVCVLAGVYFVLLHKNNLRNEDVAQAPSPVEILAIPTVDDADPKEPEPEIQTAPPLPPEPDLWAEMKLSLTGKSDYQRWCLLQDFIKNNPDPAQKEAEQAFHSIDNSVHISAREKMRQLFYKIRSENTQQNYRKIHNADEFIRMSSDISTFLKMAEEMPRWAEDVCDENARRELVNMQQNVQNYAQRITRRDQQKEQNRRNSQIRKIKQDAFAKICRTLRSANRNEAENAVKDWLKEYDSTLSPTERDNAAKLLQLIGHLHTPLYKLLDDNKAALTGKEIFPISLSDEFFNRADEKALYCQTNQDGITIVQKRLWSALEDERRNLICDLIFAKNTLTKLDKTSQSILLEQAVFQNVPLEKLKAEYTKKLKLSDDEQKQFFAVIELLPADIYTK